MNVWCTILLACSYWSSLNKEVNIRTYNSTTMNSTKPKANRKHTKYKDTHYSTSYLQYRWDNTVAEAVLLSVLDYGDIICKPAASCIFKTIDSVIRLITRDSQHGTLYGMINTCISSSIQPSLDIYSTTLYNIYQPKSLFSHRSILIFENLLLVFVHQTINQSGQLITIIINHLTPLSTVIFWFNKLFLTSVS